MKVTIVLMNRQWEGGEGDQPKKSQHNFSVRRGEGHPGNPSGYASVDRYTFLFSDTNYIFSEVCLQKQRERALIFDRQRKELNLNKNA